MTPLPVDAAVANALIGRRVSRLVHFTGSRNLPRLIVDGQLRSAADLQSENFVLHAETDPWRNDGHPDKISCSIEFPNVHYLRQVRARTQNFPDWVYVLLEPWVAAIPGSLFAVANASRRDVYPATGVAGFEACYSDPIVTSARRIDRAHRHHTASPTDMQAEVLVVAPVPLSAVIGIVVPSPAAAAHERDRLEFLHHDPGEFQWLVSPGLFDVDTVRAAVRNSQVIPQYPFSAGEV